MPDNLPMKRPLSSTPDDGYIWFIDRFCTTLWGGLQRIFNQISHILVKLIVNSRKKPLVKAGFPVIMRL
jgi:hypothetical protein